MFQTEEKIWKNIITPDGEEEFQIRYIRRENVGVVTTRSSKSYFILDSMDYWYDVIQERYPGMEKCSCKNSYFRLSFAYTPRIGTDDYRAIAITACCTECGRQKRIAEIDMDYSPTSHLFAQPITYCERPKIKYKTYSVKGYWKEDELYDVVTFLSQKPLLIYCWYWDPTEKRRCVNRLTGDELQSFLFVKKESFLQIYFSLEILDEVFAGSASDGDGIYVDRDLWRKREVIVLDTPILVAAKGAGYFYSMEFCSEYLEAGQIKAKKEVFCQLIQELLVYLRGRLK